jgi:hypothetical protein
MSNRSGTGGRLQRFLGRTGPPQQGQDHGIVRPSPEGDPDGASELNGIGSDSDAAIAQSDDLDRGRALRQLAVAGAFFRDGIT